MTLNQEKSLPKEYIFKVLNNFTNLSLQTQYTDTMLVGFINEPTPRYMLQKLTHKESYHSN